MKGRWFLSVALAFGLACLAFASAALASTDGRGGTVAAHRAPSLAASTTVHIADRQFNPQDVLYTQYDNAGGVSVTSQDIYDFGVVSELADDFTVPSGATWTVDTVDAAGVYYNGSGPADSFNVRFYSNDSGHPGTVVASALASAYSFASNDFTITLSTPAVLPAGDYWVSVQAEMAFG